METRCRLTASMEFRLPANAESVAPFLDSRERIELAEVLTLEKDFCPLAVRARHCLSMRALLFERACRGVRKRVGGVGSI